MPTLDWLNRAQAFTTYGRVPYRLLEEVSIHTPTTKTETSQPEPAQATPVQAELIAARPEPVEGSEPGTLRRPQDRPSSARTEIHDNLGALKALLPFYRGQEKCIFIELWASKSSGRCLFKQIVKERDGVGMSGQLDASPA